MHTVMRCLNILNYILLYAVNNMLQYCSDIGGYTKTPKMYHTGNVLPAWKLLRMLNYFFLLFTLSHNPDSIHVFCPLSACQMNE